MHLDGLYGPTIADFPGIVTSRLILVIYLTVLAVEVAATIGLVVWAFSERRKRLAAENGAAFYGGGLSAPPHA